MFEIFSAKENELGFVLKCYKKNVFELGMFLTIKQFYFNLFSLVKPWTYI